MSGRGADEKKTGTDIFFDLVVYPTNYDKLGTLVMLLREAMEKQGMPVAAGTYRVTIHRLDPLSKPN